MYNTYLCDQNQQSIFSVFCTDLKKTVDPREKNKFHCVVTFIG